MLKKQISIIMAIAMTAFIASPLYAWSTANPRALAMGGAYTAIGTDNEAASFNPANLGLSFNRTFTLNLVNFGIGIKNNSFSLDDYNTYTGQFLTDDDKDAILAKIPAEGLKFNVITEAGSMNFSVWRLAFNFRGLGATRFNIDKDPFELLLYGNAVKSEVSLDNTSGEALAVGDGSVSYGHPLMKWNGGELAVGATFHYLYGIAYEKITQAEGNVTTTDDGFEGSAIMKVKSALGGGGTAFDVGGTVLFEDKWIFSACWHNLYSKINWTKDTEELVYTFNMDPINFDAINDSEDSDSLIESNDTTYSIESFSSKLPAVIKLGLSRAYSKLTWAVDWEQGVSSGASQAVTPRLSAGLEYRPIGVFPLRIGTSFGGDRGTIYSTGFGIYMGPVHLDMAIANNGSIKPNGTKGALFAFAMGLRF